MSPSTGRGKKAAAKKAAKKAAPAKGKGKKAAKDSEEEEEEEEEKEEKKADVKPADAVFLPSSTSSYACYNFSELEREEKDCH